MLLAILGLVLTLLVPGLLAARLFVGGEERTSVSAFEFVAIAAALGALVTGVVAQLLAWALVWTPTSFYLVLAAVCTLAVVLAQRRQLAFPKVRAGAWDVVAVAVIAVLASRYLPMAEHVFGSSDEGIYPCAAMEVVHSGGVTFADPVLNAIPSDWRLVTNNDFLPGFYGLDREARTWSTPHGLHMLPSFMAVLHALGGREFMLLAPLVLTIVALAALWLLVRRLAGPVPALLCTVAFGVNPLSVFFAKITFAESMSAAFLFAGFAAFACAWPRDESVDPIAGPGAGDVPEHRIHGGWLFAAGLLLGGVNHAKIDFFLMPWAVLVGVVMLVWVQRDRRGALPFVAGYGLMFVLAVVYAATDHWVYYYAQFFNTQMYADGRNRNMYLAGVFVPMVSTAIVLARPSLVRAIGTAIRPRAVTIAVGVVTSLAAAYLLWGVPLRLEWHELLAATPDALPAWKKSLALAPDLSPYSGTPTFTELTIPTLGLYVTDLAALLGVVGAFVLLLRRDRGAIAPFVLFFFAQTAMLVLISGKIDYTAGNFHSPGRRFLGISGPGAVIMAIVPWFLLARGLRWGHVLRLVGVWIAVHVAFVGDEASRALRESPLWDRTFEDVDAIVAQLPPNAVLLSFEETLATRYQIPLRFFGRVPALWLYDGALPEHLSMLVEHLREQGHHPVLITGQETPDELPAKRHMMAVLDPFGYSTYQVTENTYAQIRGGLPGVDDFVPWCPILEFHGATARPVEPALEDASR
ncbi:hypothetical protein Pla163_22860 [Planctomycetes bacterium Pla163]|uniref:Glycosyltransferase RgtA/B/C/D-like domain-containing protein n=1 Tax=Rohdeia mirabilis TaxID=2528008 RepID=A0A518D124_9BACT|nr:hypothetical protein Pla163_22860 [Planctomycetes bacterium Pla163]